MLLQSMLRSHMYSVVVFHTCYKQTVHRQLSMSHPCLQLCMYLLLPSCAALSGISPLSALRPTMTSTGCQTHILLTSHNMYCTVCLMDTNHPVLGCFVIRTYYYTTDCRTTSISHILHHVSYRRSSYVPGGVCRSGTRTRLPVEILTDTHSSHLTSGLGHGMNGSSIVLPSMCAAADPGHPFFFCPRPTSLHQTCLSLCDVRSPAQPLSTVHVVAVSACAWRAACPPPRDTPGRVTPGRGAPDVPPHSCVHHIPYTFKPSMAYSYCPTTQ